MRYCYTNTVDFIQLLNGRTDGYSHTEKEQQIHAWLHTKRINRDLWV